MPTMTTRSLVPTLYLARDLGNRRWALAFTTTRGEPPRRRVMPARDLPHLDREVERARTHFGLPDESPVVSCYEAGRDGFWLHRALTVRGIGNTVIDSASIEVNRRKRRAKSDRLDVEGLLALLLRAESGDRRSWHPVTVPTDEAEDWRQLHRELRLLTRERTRGRNRLKGLLANHGVVVTSLRQFPQHLPLLRRWDGSALPDRLQQRLVREWGRLTLVMAHQQSLVRE